MTDPDDPLDDALEPDTLDTLDLRLRAAMREVEVSESTRAAILAAALEEFHSPLEARRQRRDATRPSTATQHRATRRALTVAATLVVAVGAIAGIRAATDRNDASTVQAPTATVAAIDRDASGAGARNSAPAEPGAAPERAGAEVALPDGAPTDGATDAVNDSGDATRAQPGLNPAVEATPVSAAQPTTVVQAHGATVPVADSPAELRVVRARTSAPPTRPATAPACLPPEATYVSELTYRGEPAILVDLGADVAALAASTCEVLASLPR